MHAAEGILTTRGGMTSHAAVVARGMGKPCVSGAGSLRVDYCGRHDDGAGNHRFKQGDIITIDGSTGQVLAGRVPMIEPELSGEFGTLMGWADKVRKLGVRANADTPDDARIALEVRRRRHRAVPHRTHVLRRRPHPRRARDDPGRRRTARAAPRSPSSCRCSAPTSSNCSRSCRACRSPSGCSIRRCTNSCRIPRRKSPKWPQALGADPRKLADRAARTCRIQSDARLSRLPLGHRLSGNRRDAGARHLRGGGRGRQAHRQAGGAGSDGSADRHQAGIRPGQGAHRRHGGGGGDGNRRRRSTIRSAP